MIDGGFSAWLQIAGADHGRPVGTSHISPECLLVGARKVADMFVWWTSRSTSH